MRDATTVHHFALFHDGHHSASHSLHILLSQALSQRMQADLSMEDEQVIVVDDEPTAVDASQPIPGPSFYGQEVPQPEPKTIAEAVIRSSRRRGASTAVVDDDFERPYRPSRSSRSGRHRAGGAQPKLKLKFAEKSGSMAPGMSFLGQYGPRAGLRR